MKHTKIRIGVSLCLLGERVRYDGEHKRDPFLTEILSRYVEWVPVCPEVEVGMGVPRESVQLVESASGIRMMGVRSKKDWTDPMIQFSSWRAKQLQGLHAFIFKKDSPSCGMERVRIHSSKGVKRKGRGIFADTFIRMHPLLPVEEEGRLQDPVLRENFIERMFCYARLTNLLAACGAPHDLVAFHSRHKMTLLSHSPEDYRVLGRIVARAGKLTSQVLQKYSSCFMNTLKRRATPRKHANVLQHLMGFLKESLDTDDKQELVYHIEEYCKGNLPLIMPITLLKHHFRKHPNAWIQQQVYLDPYPAELMLRNHV
ncbi:DUF523 and DUF1722 domain-containing protein [bacterium]|nr:DUF523 and DUF1722 domain-containing protein [bacterium]